MARYANAFVIAAVLVGIAGAAFSAENHGGPVKVRPERFYPVLMPNGKLWGVSVQAIAEGQFAICAKESGDGGSTWSDQRTVAELPRVTPPITSWGDGVPLVDQKGVLHYFILRWDQTNRTAATAKLALWHLKSPEPYDKWTEPKLCFDGYIGAMLSAVETPNGTLVAPFAFMTDRHYSKAAEGLMGYLYMGEHTSTAVYSTDGGDTFKASPTPVNLPASIIIGNENGAVEPVCLTLKDGRVWMLIRTQKGRMWESFSSDGISWSSPRPSRFLASDSPAALTRLKDGRIVAIWNCCQRYPYAHGGRQILHAAISDDDGGTWQGFREVVRDPRRLEPAHPITGDYGTAYPIASPTPDGKLVFSTGQGKSIGVFTLDPEWLRQTEQSEDFLHGLDDWSVYGTKGVELVPHPDKSKSKRLLKDALRVERVKGDFPAGAVWNFPNGRQGTLRISFQLLPGPARTAITLTDHFSSPFDAEAELNSLFTLQVAENMPGPGDRPLRAGDWQHLELKWDVANKTCKASINNEHWKDLPQLRLVTEGANYLRFHSLDDKPVGGGVLVESISANVELSKPGISPVDLQ